MKEENRKQSNKEVKNKQVIIMTEREAETKKPSLRDVTSNPSRRRRVGLRKERENKF